MIAQLQGPCGEWKEKREAGNLPINSPKFKTFRWEKSLLLLFEAFAVTQGFHALHVISSAFNFDLNQLRQSIYTDTTRLETFKKFRKPTDVSISRIEERLNALRLRIDNLSRQLHMRYDVTARRLGYKQASEALLFELNLSGTRHIPESHDLNDLAQGEFDALTLGDFISKLV